jgi:predicted  nucleic acid-binding Zn-ribbon protein
MCLLPHQRIDTIHELDIQHQLAIHESDMVGKDEELRRLKLRVLMLKDDQALLNDQLTDKCNRIRSLTQECESLRAELNSCQNESQGQSRTQTREIAALKV